MRTCATTSQAIEPIKNRRHFWISQLAEHVHSFHVERYTKATHNARQMNIYGKDGQIIIMHFYYFSKNMSVHVH